MDRVALAGLAPHLAADRVGWRLGGSAARRLGGSAAYRLTALPPYGFGPIATPQGIVPAGIRLSTVMVSVLTTVMSFPGPLAV